MSMRLNKAKVILGSLIVFQCSFFGCKKCKEQNVFTYDHFADYYYDGLMGFEGSESLSFIKNSNDTVVFKGQGLQRYFNEVESDYGDCLATYRLLNEKVIFKSSKEGEIVFHYFLSNPENSNSQTFELVFNSTQLIDVISAFDYYEHPFDTNVLYGDRTYDNVRKFMANGNDSIHLNNSSTDQPNRRILRVKLKNDVYELIP